MAHTEVASNAIDERSANPPRVWTTLLTNTAYLPGLLNLDYSIKRSKSAYQLVVLHTDDLPKAAHAALDLRGIRKRRVAYLSPTAARDYGDDPRFNDCWTKLACFGLTEFERVVQLDSDMLVMRNMDELMMLPLDTPEMEGKGNRVFAASHACVCNPLQKSHYPADWVSSSCAFTSQHEKPNEAQLTGAHCNGGLQHLNGGLVVVNPSMAVFNLILATLNSARTAEYAFPDQSLLSDLFQGRWVSLPYIYNALKTMRWKGIHDTIWRDEKVKNVHYILSPKPWENRATQIDNDAVLHNWFWSANDERIEAEEKASIVGRS